MLRIKWPKLHVRGDTIIEVMFATAIAALIVVITFSVMNRNLSQIQTSVEVTFARQALDGEADALRLIRTEYHANKNDPDPAGYPAMWRAITNESTGYLKTSATPFGTCSPTAADKPFYIQGASASNPDGDAVGVQSLAIYPYTSSANTYAQVGRGIWVEAVKGVTPTGAKYVDLHIRACWSPPYVSNTPATVGTIVRHYYEPTVPLPTSFACSDAIDNDVPADGRIDYGTGPSNDPGCTFASDNSERDPPAITITASPSTVYYPPGPNNSVVSWSNPDGTAISCTSTNFPASNNPPATSGAFNTGTVTSARTYNITCTNAFVESATRTVTINVTPAICSDGVDNDGDTRTDYPSDPGCSSAGDLDEYNSWACNDGVDNDADWDNNYPNDIGCSGYYDNDEYNTPPSRTALYRCYQYYAWDGRPRILTNHLYYTGQSGTVGVGCYPGVGGTVNYESVMGYAPESWNPGRVAVYGGWNVDPFYDAFFTSDYNEYVGAHNAGWNYASGFQFWAYPYPCTVKNTVPLYRYWSDYVGNHFYTIYPGENPNNFGPYDGGGTFVYEGVIGCIFNSTYP